MDERERRAYDEALEEIRGLRAVLDVLKGTVTMSTRQRVSFAEEASRRSGVPVPRLLRELGARGSWRATTAGAVRRAADSGVAIMIGIRRTYLFWDSKRWYVMERDVTKH